MTPREVADRWRCNVASVLKAIHAGRLASFRVPGCRIYRIAVAEVERVERAGGASETPAKRKRRLSNAAEVGLSLLSKYKDIA